MTVGCVGYMEMPMNFRYHNVILQGKPSKCRPSMDSGHRAKIFSPFDALTGFSGALASKDVLYVNKVTLDEADKDEINRRLSILHSLTLNGAMARKNRVMVSVTYFKPCVDRNNDAYHDQPVYCRGQYITVSGVAEKVDGEIGHCIVIGDITESGCNVGALLGNDKAGHNAADSSAIGHTTASHSTGNNSAANHTVARNAVIAFSDILRLESNHAVEGIDSCSGIFDVAWEADAP